MFFYFFGRPVSSWFLMALVAAWVGYWVFTFELKRRAQGDYINDLLWAYPLCVPVWFLGAHLAQLLTVDSTVSSGIPSQGYVFYGGLVSLLLYWLLLWWVRKWGRFFLLQELFDVGSLAMAFAFFFGRIGCTLYGCCYGKPSGAWPGLIYPFHHPKGTDDFPDFPLALRGIPLHPAPLYEAMGLLGISFLLFWMMQKQRKREKKYPAGVMGSLCWILYAVLRFFIEWIRLDPRGDFYWGLSPSQYFALLSLLIFSVAFYWDLKKDRIPLFLRKKRSNRG